MNTWAEYNFDSIGDLDAFLDALMGTEPSDADANRRRASLRWFANRNVVLAVVAGVALWLGLWWALR